MMKNKSKVLETILIIGICMSLTFVLAVIIYYSIGRNCYSEVEETVICHRQQQQNTEVEVIEEEQETFPIDTNALLAINENAVGWIQFPQDGGLAVINYPVVHSTNDEEDRFYLHHTIDGTYHFSGTIITASWQQGDFSKESKEHNTILFGHAMNDGTMFAGLKHLEDQEIFDANNTFYIYTMDKRKLTCQIMSVYDTTKYSDAYTYEFADLTEYHKFQDAVLERSVVETGMSANVKQKMVTLSTCTNRSRSGRTVVHALITEEKQF